MTGKKTILVLFGGQSSEHDISCLSAGNVVPCIDEEKYQILVVGITKEGKWLYVRSPEQIRDGSWEQSGTSAFLSPDAVEKSLWLFENEKEPRKVRIDVVFPVLHGLFGEDGTVQGLFELARIPYVGCGVLSSAVTMDKFYTKLIVDTLGIRQAAYVKVFRKELREPEKVFSRVEEKLSYPVFVKPSRAGSSVGVSQAFNREDLLHALTVAAGHDSKILVEETICGRELECAVFCSEKPEVSGVGEILSAAQFYDFDAKYNNEESRTVLSPALPEGVEEEIRRDAIRIFEAMDGWSMARIDFFLDDQGVVFNEINTIPGFTAISMYPVLWEERGVDKKKLISDLIETAFLRG